MGTVNLAAQTAWAELHALIDLQLCPLGLRAMEALPLHAGAAVLDVGCGAGQTLLQLADRVGTQGQVIGVDIAPLPLAVAGRTAAAPVWAIPPAWNSRPPSGS